LTDELEGDRDVSASNGEGDSSVGLLGDGRGKRASIGAETLVLVKNKRSADRISSKTASSVHLEGQVFLGVSVVINVDLIEVAVAEGVIVGASKRILEGIKVGKNGDKV